MLNLLISAPNRDDECITKQEAPQCSVEGEDSGVAPGSTNGAEVAEWNGVGQEAARVVLYDEHEVKHELVLGPGRLQPQDIALPLAAASNRADKDSVEQEPVHNVVEIEGTGERASPAQDAHLNSLLEQLVQSTCYVRLERTPVSKEPTCQTPHKSLDLSSLMSDKNKHTEEESDVERNVQRETKVHTERNSYICDFCGKQLTRKKKLIRHIHINMERNADTLHTMSSEQDSVKRELIKHQCSRGAGQGSRSAKSLGEQVALQTTGSKEPTGQTPQKSLDLSSLMSDSNKRSGEEPDVEKKAHQETKGHTKRISYICDFCGMQFTQKRNLIKHIRINMERNADTLHRMSSEQDSVKHELVKQQCPLRGAGQGPCSGEGRGEQMALRTCCVRLQRLPGDSESRPLDHAASRHTHSHNESAEQTHSETQVSESKHSCDICKKVFTTFSDLREHAVKHNREEKISCDICKKTFQKYKLSMHIKQVHIDAHSSKVYNKLLSSKSDLSRLKRIRTGKKHFTCQVCNKQYSCNSKLIIHMRIHTGEKPFPCEICEKKFTDNGGLIRHMIIHTGEKRFTCDVCSKQFLHNSHLIRHKRIHTTGEKPFICDICNRAFSYKCNLITHMRIHTGEKSFNCELCKKQFIQNSDLIKHMRIHTGDKSINCELCKKQFTQNSYLIKHMRIHTGDKSINCELCKKQFTQNSDLIKHMRIHTGDKYFTCEICEKKFTRRCFLFSHMRVHTDEGPYPCDICKLKFRRRYNLIEHVRIHTGERPFLCEICKKQFRRSTILRNHRRTHTGEKPYSCDMCNKQFAHSSSLPDHMRLHTGEKPFSCEICEKKFTQKCSLINHLRIHTGVKAFICDICKKRFTQNSTLRNHMRIHKRDQ